MKSVTKASYWNVIQKVINIIYIGLCLHVHKILRVDPFNGSLISKFPKLSLFKTIYNNFVNF